MEVCELGRRLVYINNGSGDCDAATARSECEISPQCGVFYFEMKILDRGRDGFFSIGVVTKASLLKKLVGWDTGTIGYHGDDGCVYMGSGKGHNFGPTYTEGDLIGCGVNFVKKQIFFTKNGIYIGHQRYPLSSSNDSLYAAFGMKSPCESASANFGFNSFSFDIEGYILKEQEEFTQTACDAVSLKIDPPISELLILKHLIHQGCEKTALAFFNSAFSPLQSKLISEEEILKILKRAKLRKEYLDLVMSGNIEMLFGKLDQSYPKLLENNPELEFLLYCRMFIEAVDKSRSDDPNAFNKIFKIGQTIECKLSPLHNHTLHILARDTLALIAYKNMKDSPSSYLLSDNHRSSIASQLDSAMLKSDQLSPYSELEKLIRAYQCNTDYLKDQGSIEAALSESVSFIMRSQSIKPE